MIKRFRRASALLCKIPFVTDFFFSLSSAFVLVVSCCCLPCRCQRLSLNQPLPHPLPVLHWAHWTGLFSSALEGAPCFHVSYVPHRNAIVCAAAALSMCAGNDWANLMACEDFFYTFVHLFFATMGGRAVGACVLIHDAISILLRHKKKCIVPYVARVDGWCGQRTHTFIPPQYQDSLKLRNDRIIKNQQHVRALANIFTYTLPITSFFILW